MGLRESTRNVEKLAIVGVFFFFFFFTTHCALKGKRKKWEIDSRKIWDLGGGVTEQEF